ncbi:MAG: hydroxymethylbilane synthase [Ignavibacteriaceae bacterium]|nr:hydroxymethylbilane synthase [Ignavibacteriaceae bacterium]
MEKILKIGTRMSMLALWQSEFVKAEIEKNNPGVKVELVQIKTKGDKILDVALSKIGDKGLFTKELENELLAGNVDLAVHSLKDLETTMPEGLVLGAVSKRHPVEDVLIAKVKGMTIKNLPQGATIATGSLRRRSQLKSLRPDLNIVELRGNVPTRIQKLSENEWDGIILARAGVERLGLSEHISSFISTEDVLPAVGQGALGLQCRVNDNFVLDSIYCINDSDTHAAVSAERAFLKKLQGGCQVPIGSYARIKNCILIMDGYVGSLDGTKSLRMHITGPASIAKEIGIDLANRLLADGAEEIIAGIER